jgi:hypothetical protein
MLHARELADRIDLTNGAKTCIFNPDGVSVATGLPNHQKLGPEYRLPLVGPGPSQRTRGKERALLIVRDEFRPAIP